MNLKMIFGRFLSGSGTIHLYTLVFVFCLIQQIKAADIAVPSLVTTSADTSLSLSSEKFFNIQLSGSHAIDDEITLNANNGLLSLSSTAGLTFIGGDGSYDSTMTFKGSLADVNFAIDGATFTPNSSFSGRTTIDITAGAATETVIINVNKVIDAETARDQLLEGVTSIEFGGGLSKLVAFGEQSHGIANYPGTSGQPVVVAASLGNGKIITTGSRHHDNWSSLAGSGTTGQFYLNAVEWLAETGDLSVKILTYNSATKSWLESQGYTNVILVNESNLISHLPGTDVLLPNWLGWSESQENIDAIVDYVANGGSLYLCQDGYGHTLWVNNDMSKSPANKILLEAGIACGDLQHSNKGLVTVERSVNSLTLDELENMSTTLASASEAQQSEWFYIYDMVLVSLPGDSPVSLRLKNNFKATVQNIIPSPASKVTDLFEKKLLSFESNFLRRCPVETVYAHRSADGVYGEIAEGAARVAKTVNINTSRSKWYPTGLYAAAGEIVTINFPAEAVGIGLKVRVNSNTATLSEYNNGNNFFARPPVVTRLYQVKATTVDVVNAHGGAIFIDLGDTVRSPAVGSFDITISNAVEMPYFVLGQNSDTEWVSTLRDKPAPAALLESDYNIFSVPSSLIRSLDNAEEITQLLHDIIKSQDELVDREGLHGPRTFAEFIDTDPQVAWGAAYCGYPTVVPIPTSAVTILDINKMHTNGEWGLYHECGHNRVGDMRGWWKMPGDGEVIVNIPARYVQDLYSNGNHQRCQNDYLFSIARENFVDRGNVYEDKSWFDACFAMHSILASYFGWDVYKAFFKSYTDDYKVDPSLMPANDQEKYDQYFTRFSLACGYSMKKYMVDFFKVPVSQSAIDSVSHLPDWMPIILEGLPSARSFDGSAATLDLKTSGLYVLDDIVTVTLQTQPKYGTLTDNGNGVYIYTPVTGFTGEETILFTAVSSAGQMVNGSMTFKAHQSTKLAAHWTFDEGEGGIAGDSSASGFDSTISGGTFVDGYKGKCIDFEGNDYITLPKEVFAGIDNEISISFWCYGDDVLQPQNDSVLEAKDASGKRILNIHLPWSDQNIYWDAGDSTGVDRINKYANSSEYKGQWNHFVFTKNAVSGEMKIYLNGALWQSGTGKTKSIGTVEIVKIGSFASGGGNYDGMIDDFRIYSSELTFDDITAVFQGINRPPVAGDDAVTTDEDTAVTFFPLTNDSDPDYDKLSVQSVSQPINGVAVLDGNVIIYTPNANYNGTDSFTYTIGDDYGNTAVATVSVTVNAVNSEPVFTTNPVIAADAFEATFYSESIVSSVSDADGDSLTFSKISGPSWLTLAVDGTLTGTPAATDVGQNNFTVQVTDTAGASTEAALQINVLGKLVAHWKFDEGTGTTAVDSSGNGFDCTVTGAARVEGREGECLDFEGIDYLVVPKEVFAGIENTISISFWSYGDQVMQPQNDSIIEALDASGNRVLNIHLPWSNQNVYWDAGYAAGYDRIFKAATATEYKGQWNHWVFTKNADTGEMKIYLNGSIWHSGIGKTRSIANVETVKIGSTANGTSNYDGMLDDFRIYRTALSDIEVTELCNSYAWAPIATDDFAVTNEEFATEVAVLVNDSDQNGDLLTVTAVTQGGKRFTAITPTIGIT